MISKKDYDVFGVVRKLPKDPLKNINYLEIDLSSNWKKSMLPARADKVIHLAQSRNFRNFPDKAKDIFRVNINTTSKLLDYCNDVKVENFLYASSGGVYGNSKNLFKENSPIVKPGKLGYYLGSKLCGEILSQSYSSFYNVIILRFFFIYGKEQSRNMLMPRLFDNVNENKQITLQDESGIRINPIHVADASSAVLSALDVNENSIFNISGNEIVSLKKICDIIGSRINKEPVYHIEPGNPNDLIGDNSLMKECLHNPLISLENGIEDLII
tara:strand:- start:376 stop:1188 length:813 start_codon:yes stop_codon:yes gene_type:complete